MFAGDVALISKPATKFYIILKKLEMLKIINEKQKQ